jgi:hypothetical protein
VQTVAETAVFLRCVDAVWTQAEREQFIAYIAAHPKAGDLIPGSGGCRKVRWSASGRGKRGGARVIYFIGSDLTIWLLMVYTKAKFDNLPTSFLVDLKREIEDAFRDEKIPGRSAGVSTADEARTGGEGYEGEAAGGRRSSREDRPVTTAVRGIVGCLAENFAGLGAGTQGADGCSHNVAPIGGQSPRGSGRTERMTAGHRSSEAERTT